MFGDTLDLWAGDLWDLRRWDEARDVRLLAQAFRDLRMSAWRWPTLPEFVDCFRPINERQIISDNEPPLRALEKERSPEEKAAAEARAKAGRAIVAENIAKMLRIVGVRRA